MKIFEWMVGRSMVERDIDGAMLWMLEGRDRDVESGSV